MSVSSIQSQSATYSYEAEEIPSEETSMPTEEAPENPAPADGYTDGTRKIEGGLSPENLKKELTDWYEQVRQDHTLAYNKKNELLLSIRDLQKLLNSHETSVPQEILDAFFLIQAEFAVGVGQAEEQVQIEELEARFKTLLADLSLEGETRSQLETLRQELGRVKSGLELAADSEALNQAEASVKKIAEGIEEILTAARTAREEKVSSLQQKIEELNQSMNEAKCSKKDKLHAAKKMAALKTLLEADPVPFEEVERQIEEIRKFIQSSVEETAERAALKAAYQGLSKQIPLTLIGSEETAEFAAKLSKAVEDGNWKSFERYFEKMTENDDIAHYDTEIAIEVVIGTLYYGPAGESDKKLKKLLDLIPVRIRERMIHWLNVNDGDFRGFGVDDNPEQKRSNKVYGKKNKTTDILEASIRYSKKN